MSFNPRLADFEFTGIDISLQAIELRTSNETSSVEYVCADISSASDGSYDLLLAIDVFGRVSDYLGFLEDCQRKADYKVYHIPLDLHASSLVRTSFINMRTSLGPLHYFTAGLAIATLEDTGHEVIESVYTCGGADLLKHHLTPKKIVAHGPLWFASKVYPGLGARILGGFALLVLALNWLRSEGRPPCRPQLRIYITANDRGVTS